jgi:hypothetical protein
MLLKEISDNAPKLGASSLSGFVKLHCLQPTADKSLILGFIPILLAIQIL